MSFITRFVEDVNVVRYYSDFIKAGGGLDEVKNALRWSVWYALKWWHEIYREGLYKNNNVFVRALYLSLLENGYIDREGRIIRRIKEPKPPVNTYTAEFVSLHESFDRIGAVKIAANQVDENTIAILYSTMLTQGWYEMMRSTFFKLVGAANFKRLYFPVIKEGHDIASLIGVLQAQPEVVIGYDYRGDSVELSKEVLGNGVSVGTCPGRGICIFQATSTCEVADLLGGIQPVEAAVLFHSLYWMLDPMRDLLCLKRILKPNGYLLVGQQVVESTPGLVAIVSAMGAKHVFRSSDVENIISAAGYKKEKVYLRTTPFYIAVWRN